MRRPCRPPSKPADDLTLLLPDSAEVFHQALGDLDGDCTAERVFLAGFGGSPDRLGYDALNLLLVTSDAGLTLVAKATRLGIPRISVAPHSFHGHRIGA